MAEAGSVAEGCHTFGTGRCGKAIDASAVLTAAADVVMDGGDLHLLAADVDLYGVLGVDRTERAGGGTLSAPVADLSLKEGRFLDLTVGDDHMEALA